MAYIISVGTGIPKHDINQEDAKTMVRSLFEGDRRMEKLLPVFDNAMVDHRQIVQDMDFYTKSHTFKEKNAIYHKETITLSLEAIDNCLYPPQNHPPFSYELVDAIIFVSSSGIATPSLDAYLINERSFREDIVRMPLWGLGCAGGAMGLSRGYEWLKANPEKSALVVSCELCSMTFQSEDQSMSNLVATALFGDGAAATLLLGEKSPYNDFIKKDTPRICSTDSKLAKGTTDMMGWDVTDKGLEVIFSKNIPKHVPEIWGNHVERFLEDKKMDIDNINTFLAHPGGRKVLEAMEKTFGIPKERFHHAYEVLQNHGNMSSSTVLYVLKKWMENSAYRIKPAENVLLCSLGPGFSSELLLLERSYT